MLAARIRRIQGPLALIARSLPLIALVVWGCSLDTSGSYSPAAPTAGAGGGAGGDGGPPTPCGNGTLDTGEQCDDGNTEADDGCDDACQVECVLPEDLTGEAFMDPLTHHCYLYVYPPIAPDEVSRPWYDALYTCRAHGFELAALTSDDEQVYVDDSIGGADVWIGGDDQTAEGDFVWTDGEVWTNDSWDIGEPNDNGDHNQNCLEFKGESRFNDDACSDINDYVCERHPPGPCGDGVIDAAEECDDGNDVPGDGCSKCLVDCESLPHMGAKYKDPKSHHCYLYNDNSISWEAAAAACNDIGFYLATVSSTEERKFMVSKTMAGAWVGATDDADEMTWLWTNGESWEFDPWTGDPGNQDSKDCLRFVFDDLDASDCAEEHPYLCEQHPEGRRSPDAP